MGWIFLIDFLAPSIGVYVFALMLLYFIKIFFYKNWFWWNNKLHSQGWASGNEFEGKLYYLYMIKKAYLCVLLFIFRTFFLMKILIHIAQICKKRVKHLFNFDFIVLLFDSMHAWGHLWFLFFWVVGIYFCMIDKVQFFL